MIFETGILKAAVASLSSVTSHNSPMEPLRCLRISSGEISARGKDVSLAKISIPCEGSGVAIVDAQVIRQIISLVPEERVSLDIEGSLVVIRSGSAKHAVPTFNEDPGWVVGGEFQEIGKCQAETLKSAIRKVSCAVANVAGRFALNCIGISWPLMYATELGSAAVVRLCPGNPSDDQILIHNEALKSAAGLFETGDEVSVGYDGSQLKLSSPTTSVICRGTEGMLHRVWKIVPQKTDSSFTVDSEQLKLAIRQAMIVTTVESQGLSITFRPGEAVMRSKGSDRGNSEIVVPGELSGEGSTVCLNSRLLSAYSTKTSRDESVRIMFNQGIGHLAFRQQDFAYMISQTEVES